VAFLRFQIKDGVTRRVFLIGRWAFKIPHPRSWKFFLLGLLANMQEREWSSFSERLCPVRWALPGGWLVVMPRAEPISDDDWALLLPILGYEAFINHNDCRLPVEQKRCSFGLLEGRLVAVDYGS
jgi:hypothetical protein